MRRIDAGVEERDGDPGAVEAGDLEVGDGDGRTPPSSDSERLRRICDPDRVDADDLAVVDRAARARSGRGAPRSR